MFVFFEMQLFPGNSCNCSVWQWRHGRKCPRRCPSHGQKGSSPAAPSWCPLPGPGTTSRRSRVCRGCRLHWRQEPLPAQPVLPQSGAWRLSRGLHSLILRARFTIVDPLLIMPQLLFHVAHYRQFKQRWAGLTSLCSPASPGWQWPRPWGGADTWWPLDGCSMGGGTQGPPCWGLGLALGC